ncbi:helix-turn-helix domain-containing protein [Streptomyces sp. MP131-18]|uniref:helix-turn-helix domain-containing protein n=1 Tax=Streptomyces sp. MP131-18 TaxID=1857892 RepID=UPI00097BFB21|nr:helix-turn-helix domain-containing protein [Streptomyces sp. MP131-18]ONK11019.1 transcriptional regulator, y4mF family [Streptomyces sp. MP131-18]
MHDESSAGDQLRYLRRSRGLTQESLAERAGLRPGVVKKIEGGGNARIETYHALARALDVRTSRLFESGPPHRDRRGDEDNLVLMPLRQAIAPAVGAAGPLATCGTVEPDPDLAQMRRTSDALADSYHRDEYATVAEVLPPLIHSAHLAVRHFDGGADRTEALRLRGRVLQMAGRYLVQVRAYDLAQTALRHAVEDAATSGDQAGVAAAVYQQGWLLIRQGRLDEAEQVSVVTADDAEPRISRASRAALGAWGKLLVHASSAAARNNRPNEAREMLRLARTAGVALGGATAVDNGSWGRFDWRTVAYQAIENQMVAQRPTRALALAARMPPLPKGQTFGRRHLLDVAQAHAMLRQSDDALGILASLRSETPEWLRHQRLAADVFRDARRARRRALSREQRALGEFLGAQ